KDKRYGHSVGAAKAAANQDEQNGKRDQQKCGSKDLHVRSSNFPRGPSPRKFSVEAASARVKLAASTRAQEFRKLLPAAGRSSGLLRRLLFLRSCRALEAHLLRPAVAVHHGAVAGQTAPVATAQPQRP